MHKQKLGERSYQQRAQLGSEITESGNIVTWVQENGVHEVSLYNWGETNYLYSGKEYNTAAEVFKAAATNQ